MAAGSPRLLPGECTPTGVEEGGSGCQGSWGLPKSSPHGSGCQGSWGLPKSSPRPVDVSPAPPSNGTCTLIQEVGQEAAHDSLVGDDEDIALALQLHDDRLQPLHQVLVGLWGK